MKIKVKHLLLLILFLVLVWFGKSFVVDQVLYATGKNYVENGNKEEGIVYLRKYIQEFPKQKKAIKAMQEVLEKIPDPQTLIVIFPKGSSGGGMLALDEVENLELLNKDFDQLKKYHSKEELFEVQLELAKINYQAGNIEQAISYYEDLQELSCEEMKQYVNFLLGMLYLEQGQIDQSLELLDKIVDTREDVRVVKFWTQLIRGIPKFYKQFGYNTWIDADLTDYGFDTDRYMNSDNMDMIYRNLIGKEVNLEGVITKLGKPMVNVMVMLRTKEDSFSTDDFEYMTVTNKNGQYQFRDIRPGVYQIGIGLSNMRIGDVIYQTPKEDVVIKKGEKISRDLKFSPPLKIIEPAESQVLNELKDVSIRWDDYPGASYYRLFVGVKTDEKISTHEINDNIYGTEGVLNLNREILFFGIGYTKRGIEPGGILGYDHSPSTIIYGVKAFSEDGQLLARNLDPHYLQRFKYTGKSLSKADQLLYECKYEEAINAYEKNIQNNPDDVHSLKVLGMLYYFGYQLDKTGQDYEKAWRYLSRSYELMQEEPIPDDNLYWILWDLSIRVEDLKSAHQYVETYLKKIPEQSYWWLRRGKLALYEGDFTKAKEAILKSLQIQLEDNQEELEKKLKFVTSSPDDNEEFEFSIPSRFLTGQGLLITTYLLEGQEEEALKVEENFNDEDCKYTQLLKKCVEVLDLTEMENFFKLVNDGDIDGAIQSIPDTETGRFYKALNLVLQPPWKIEDEFCRIYEQETRLELKEFLKQLGREVVSTVFPARFYND